MNWIARALGFALQFFGLFPIVLFVLSPFLEAMGSALTKSEPLTGWAYREILLFGGVGLVAGFLAGMFMRIGGLSAFAYGAHRIWVIPVLSFAVESALSIMKPRREWPPVTLYFHKASGLEVLLLTLPAVLYAGYGVGAWVAWRWKRLQ